MPSEFSGCSKPAERAGAANPPAPRPTGRRRRLAGAPGKIPIVDATHQIVGWTDLAPSVENGRLRHAKAERLLGGTIFCTQVALTRPLDITRAGGPTNWTGPWRCLALCPLENARGLEQLQGLAAEREKDAPPSFPR